MTAAVAGAIRGRPSNQGLAASLDASRRINANLRLELRIEHAEALAFADAVRAHAMRVYLAAVADRPDLAAHEGAAIVALADRHLRQRGGAA